LSQGMSMPSFVQTGLSVFELEVKITHPQFQFYI
jgi:hypothetical protein